MSALLDSNPDYQAVTIMRIDWDNKHLLDPIKQELQISRRSTLVMFDQGKEVGRVVAQTNRDTIEALFKAVI